MKKKLIGECYLCGEVKELTDDHVPPKAFFPHPIPNNYNLITVKACHDCNNYWGNKEKKLVQDLSIVGKSNDARQVFKNNTRENYMRGSLIRGKPSKDYFDIMGRLKKTYLTTNGVIISPNPVHVLNIPYDRDKVLIKICLGLHRKYKGKRLPTNVFSGVIMRVPDIQDQFFNLFRACSIKVRFGETFSFAGGFPIDSEDISFWYLGFYTNVDFFVVLSVNPHIIDK